MLSCKSDSWRRCTCTNVLFSLVACEDCLEVCFVGLVVKRISVWCLVIVAICMVSGMPRSRQLGVVMHVKKGGLFSKGKQVLTIYYCCIVKHYCKPYWVYTIKDFFGYLFSLYDCCFTCLRLAKPKV